VQKNTEISLRITEIIEYLKVTPHNFAKSLGYNRSQTVYDIMSGKSAPSFDFFNKFMSSEFSAIINIEWLITGTGEMLRSQESQEEKKYKAPLIPMATLVDPPASYACTMCQVKDRLIEHLEHQLTRQEKEIERITRECEHKNTGD